MNHTTYGTKVSGCARFLLNFKLIYTTTSNTCFINLLYMSLLILSNFVVVDTNGIQSNTSHFAGTNNIKEIHLETTKRI